MIARPIMKTDKGIYYSSLNSKLQRELVGDMEMMSHLGNSKYREPCTETKFKKKKEKKKILYLRKDCCNLLTFRL